MTSIEAFDQLARLNREEKEAKDRVVLGESLERLRTNRDFKKLILDGYLSAEAVRLVHLKSEPAQQSPAQQAAITRDIDAIGALNQYFATVTQLAGLGSRSLQDIEATRADIVQGDQ